MSFIPEEEMRKSGINLAPMIDFIFIMLAFFASLAVSRVATKDTEVDLVKIKPEARSVLSQADPDIKIINLSVTDKGDYKWVTEIRDYKMATAEEISNELKRQYELGLLSEEKLKTQVLLKIDKKATWEPILKAIFAVREAGFEIRPVYEPEEEGGALSSAP